jgi:DNA-binding CsgD family transcriptional regulator
LVFMAEGALLVHDLAALQTLRPLLREYEGFNLMNGTLIGTFGSADRYLARVAGALGERDEAARHFDVAREMDERMRSVVHLAETLAHRARFAAADGDSDGAREDAARARALAEPIGQVRVLRLLEALGEPDRPDGLTEREVEVLRLLAAGLSNQDIGKRLHISANTAANHVRSILMKTGAANRTQAAIYATQHLDSQI